MDPLVAPEVLGRALAEALDMDISGVTSITIRVAKGELPTVTVERRIRRPQAEAVAQVMTAYTLTKPDVETA